jgi:hypothetical protein
MPGIFDRNEPGIFGNRRARRMAAEYEAERRETVAGLDIGVDELIASTADPEEAAVWRDQFESYKELALSNDEIQQRAGITGLSTMAGQVQAAVDRRHEAQQGFIIEHARELRGRHLKATEPMRELQANMEQFNALLSDPEFDQNMALNRGTLIGLLESSTRQMLSDPEDMADALMNAGGGGLIGALVGIAGGTLAAKDFDFRKDDYARIAKAMYTFNEKRYAATVAPLELEAAALEEAAGGLDFLPPGYSLTQFITGPPETFESPFAESYTGAERAPSVPAPSGIGDVLETLSRGPETNPDAATEPFGDVRMDALSWFDNALGADTVGLELKAKIAELTGQGATVRADPATGALFATYGDGRREAVPTTTVGRSIVRRSLGAAGTPLPEVPRTERLSGIRNWARGFTRRVGRSD